MGMLVDCAGGCGRVLNIRKEHLGADDGKYWCFACSEAGLADEPTAEPEVKGEEKMGPSTSAETQEETYKRLSASTFATDASWNESLSTYATTVKRNKGHSETSQCVQDLAALLRRRSEGWTLGQYVAVLAEFNALVAGAALTGEQKGAIAGMLVRISEAMLAMAHVTFMAEKLLGHSISDPTVPTRSNPTERTQ